MTTYSYDRSIYEAESGDILMALTGESLITRAVSRDREPDFTKLVEMIRSADVGFTHAEMLFHDYEPTPAYMSGGTYMRSDPHNIAELQWMGFDFLSTACNHSFDYGEGGVLKNIENLRKFNMPFAGTGRNLAEARGPVYIETSKGRIALLSATTSGPPPGRAGDQRRDVQGRPGSNYIRHTVEYVVDKPTFDAIRLTSQGLHFEEQKERRRVGGFGAPLPPDTDTEFYLVGLWPMYESLSWVKFTLGAKFERHSTPHAGDLEGWLQRVRDARGMADWVICTMHNHESGNTEDEPAEAVQTIMRSCIDAGADVFVGHGPHQDRGIEIYNGKPIFYSLGDFFLENDTVLLQPQDNYLGQGLSWEHTPEQFYNTRSANETRGQTVAPRRWESALAMTKWNKGHEFAEIRLHPVDLGFGKPRYQRGRPVLADGDVAREILDRFERLSALYGTKVTREGNVGIVRP
ncbi:MAG: CapA family protein [Dehalococcoidia bacterium]